MAASWPPSSRDPMSSVSGWGWGVGWKGWRGALTLKVCYQPAEYEQQVPLKMWVHLPYFKGRGPLPRKPIKMLLVETCHVSLQLWREPRLLFRSLSLPCLMLTCKEHIWRWELFIWPLHKGAASKNIHTVSRQKEWEQCASLGCIPSSVEKHVYQNRHPA